MLQFLQTSDQVRIKLHKSSHALEILHRRRRERAAPVGEAIQARIFGQSVLLQILAFDERYFEAIGNG
jgi:hypothetical protein